MISHQTHTQSLARRRAVSKPEFSGFVTDMIVPQPGLAPRPQAFLVEQKPNWTLPPHFHQEHQFQVFVAGSGTFGSKPIPRLAVHYASPHAGYGPLRSGQQGLSYLTLRAVGDTGAWYLPDRRAANLRIAKKQAHGQPAQALEPDAVARLTAPAVEPLIAPDRDGLAAWLVRLPADAGSAAPPEDAASGGRFYVLASGSLQLADAEPGGLAAVWAQAGTDWRLQAGSSGAEVVVLQFPGCAAESFVENMALPPLS